MPWQALIEQAKPKQLIFKTKSKRQKTRIIHEAIQENINIRSGIERGRILSMNSGRLPFTLGPRIRDGVLRSGMLLYLHLILK